MPWKELEHTADMGLEISAQKVSSLVNESASALYQVMFGYDAPGPFIRREHISVSGMDMVEVMVSWMNELLYIYDVSRSMVMVDQVCFMSGQKKLLVEVRLHEAPPLLTQVKAVTYGGVQLSLEPPLLRVYLDI